MLFPQLSPAPMFGLTEDEQQLAQTIGQPSLLGQPTTVVPASATSGWRAPTMAWLSAQTEGAVGTGNDPAQWTPEEAASQTDRALARIGQANPELAQVLAAQHGKSAAEGQDLPWYKDILKGVGEVLHATKLDVVFEYLGRASHIVPEIIHDWGNESVWKNVGDALSGRANDITWSDVLVDDLGMERSWLTAVLGFVGDVATDPLTYLTMGTGGLGRSAVGKTGAEAATIAALESGTLLEKGAIHELGPMMRAIMARLPEGHNTIDDVARFLVSQTEASAQPGLLTKLKQALTGVHPDAIPGAAFVLNEKAAQDAMLATVRMADNAFRDVTTIGFQRTSAKAAAEFGVDKGAMTDILRSWVREGTGFGIDKTLYRQGREAAAVLGGARLRLSIPILNIRLAGLRLPFVPAAMDFSLGRRFFGGMSGQVRLMKMVGTGEATMEDMHILWEKGFKGLRDLSTSPGVLQDFARGPRSMFYTASEGVGQLTAHLSAHAAQLRGGGLSARYAGQVDQQARHMVEQVTAEVQTVHLATGEVLQHKQTAQRLAEATASAGEKVGELGDALNEYRSLVPTPGATAKQYFDGLRQVAIERARQTGTEGSEETKSLLANLDDQAARATRAEEAILTLGGDPELGDIWRHVATNRDEVLHSAGLLPDTWDASLPRVNDLLPEEAAIHSPNGTVYTSDLVGGGQDIGVDQVTHVGSSEVPITGLHMNERGPLGTPHDIKGTSALEHDRLVRELSGGQGTQGMFSPEAVGTTTTTELADKVAANGPGDWATITKGLTPQEKALVHSTLEADRDAAARVLRDSRVETSGQKLAQAEEQVSQLEKAVAAAKAEAYKPGRSVGTAEGTYTPEAQRLMDMEERLATAKNQVARMGREHELNLSLNRAIEGRLDVLDPEEVAFAVQPDLVITDPRPLVTIDLRTPAAGPSLASDVINPVTEIEATYGPILDEIAAGDYKFAELSDDAARVVREAVASTEGKQEQLARITTKLLSERAPGVRVVTDTGTEVVMFYDSKLGAIPVARVNPRASSINSAGSQMRDVTTGAREAVLGTSTKKGERLISEILRATQRMARPSAEMKAVEMLGARGITLRAGQAFFESSPLKLLEAATHSTSSKVVGQYLGQAARHAENLGLTRGGFGQGAVGLGRYEVVLREGAVRGWAEKASAEEKAAAEAVARISDNTLEVLREHSDRLGQQALAREHALNELIDNAPARVQSLLNEVRRLTTEEARIGSRSDVVKKLETYTLSMRHAFEEGVPGAYTRIGESRALPGAEVWRIGDPAGTEGLSYITVLTDTAGGPQVVALRKVGAAFTLRDSNIADRVISGAYTHPDFERRGLGSELADMHWDDVGITSGTWQEQFTKMSRAIGAQEFSGTGAGMAENYVTRRAGQILNEARDGANKLKAEAVRARTAVDLRVTELEAHNELGKLITRTKTERAPILVALKPVGDSMNMTGMVHLDMKGFEGFNMPTFMAEEFQQAMRGYPKLDGAHAAFRQFMSWWKSMATWIIPGFHIRNMEGGIFNNWLGGVSIRDYFTSGRVRFAERELASGQPGKWAKTLLKDAEPDLVRGMHVAEPSGFVLGKNIDELTYADLAAAGANMNLTASNGRLFAEAQTTVEAETRKYTKGASYAQRIPAPYTKAMRGVGTMTENVLRTASFVRGLRDGKSMLESRAFTMMRHGDYEDMTDWEYKWVRDLIPFYKWMRTNTPFQIHQLLESPGKLLAVQKAQRAVFDAKGLDYEKEKHRMPSWMAESFIIPHGVKTEGGLTTFDTVMLDLPMGDLFMGGREFISSFLPTIRPFLESYVYGQQTFSGSPISGKKVPLNPAFNILAPLLDAVGLVERAQDGSSVISDKTQNLLGIIPIFARFKSFLYADANSVAKRSNLVASVVFGMQSRPVDLQALTSEELSFYYDQVMPTIEYLKDMGYPLPTTADLEATVGTTDQILTKLGITPGPVGATTPQGGLNG